MSTLPPLVPGGGLIAHEQAGGHTLAKHVGLTINQLFDRLANDPKPMIVSSFTDQAIAEQVIADAINANSGNISAWLQTNLPNILRIRYNANIPIGISLARGTLNPVPAYLISVILKANPNLPLGYYILTAYPEP